MILRTASFLLLDLSFLALENCKFIGIYNVKTIYSKNCVQNYEIYHLMTKSGGGCCHGPTELLKKNSIYSSFWPLLSFICFVPQFD